MLTLEQHIDLGRRLKTIWDELVRIQCHELAAYPVRHLANKHASQAYRAISELRSELEKALFTEHRAQATTDIYYAYLRKQWPIVSHTLGEFTDPKEF